MEQVVYNKSEVTVLQPGTLKEALKLINENQDADIIANASDYWPRFMKGEVRPKKILDISGLIQDLSYVKKEGNLIRLGALVTVSQLEKQDFIQLKQFAAFREAISKFGSPQIRNVATVGGNVCAASSSEDLIPIFLTFNAKVRLTSVDGDRYISLEKFILGKRQINRRPNEILTEVVIEDPGESYASTFNKIGLRNALIINIVNLAVLGKIVDKKIEDIRIAANRVKGKVPERAKETESFLKGKELNQDTVLSAKKVFDQELSLTDDFRASASYRKALLLTLLERSLNKLGGV